MVIRKRAVRLPVLAIAVTLWVPAWASPLLNPNAGASTEILSRPVVVAQAGSMGGTVGKQGKSASGGEKAQRPRSAAQRPARDKQPKRIRIAPEPRGKAAATRVNYDGNWRVSSSAGLGCGTETTNNVSVTGGIVHGSRLSGRISHGGTVNVFWRLAGWRLNYTGRVSSRSGSGVWRRHDGCTGTWTAVRE
jgi:hypothetical protein